MEMVKTDVLIIGGGIAGCFAAMCAVELEKSMVLLEK
jgi:succinate dehydrogenase/fumarate reductase flavoprotein subunit